MDIAYKRVLLKISGEALSGRRKNGIDADALGKICDQIKVMVDMGVQVAIVVGGGNFWRGRYGHQMERVTSDYMGMLATIINGLAIQDAIEARGVDTRLQTSMEMRAIAEPYIKRKAVQHLEKGRVVIFAGGTGNPYFTTDTCAALRAAETDSEVILFAKTIDGVYSADPKEDPNAVKFDEISYLDMLNKNLRVMDATATSLCMENNIPLIVFGINRPDNMVKIIKGQKIGTFVK
ncbi:MAG: UMP kinase [Oscillospiraceae bacterium]|nr:UMP kinase [Oscillospiraceae bacterium]